MRLNKYKLAVIALILANVIWGASFPIYKWSLQNVPPFTFSFLRLFLASLIILPFTMHTLTIKKQDIPHILMMSIFGITIPITAIFLGLKYAPSINGPIIVSSGPIFMILFAMLFLKEHPKRKVFIGTFVSLIGVLLIILRPVFEKGLDSSIVGNLFFLATTLGSVYHTIMTKKLIERYSIMTLTFWYMFLGSLPLIPFVVTEVHATDFMQNLNMQGLMGIGFGVLFASFIAHIIYNYGVKQIPASEVGVFAYVDPLAAILIAMPLLGETLTPVFLIGTLLVFLGICIAEARLHYHPLHKLR
ncbi:MAG: EamA family transporter [Candidatus Levybacteria bacterium]|nr:EamA family transporter [Candidatus Levybacteria bacterium]